MSLSIQPRTFLVLGDGKFYLRAKKSPFQKKHPCFSFSKEKARVVVIIIKK
jgi:hypothetical protein